MNTITSITGIADIDVLISDKLGLRFFLISDIHLKVREGFDSNGLYLPIYLDALFKKYPEKQFDLLTEFGPIKKYKVDKDSEYNSGVLQSMARQFDNCFTTIDGCKDCSGEWPNIRFHNVDIRNIQYDSPNYDRRDEINNPFSFSLLRIMRKIYKIITDIKRVNRNNKNYDNLVKNKFEVLMEHIMAIYEETINANSFGNYFISEIYKNEKYAKYKTVENIDKINMFIKNFINLEVELSDMFNKALLLKKRKNITIYEIINYVLKIEDPILNITSSFMDFYTFVIMMKIKSYGGKNIILIAGAFHILRAKDFIRTLDPDSYFKYGSCGVTDDLYNLYNLYNYTKTLQIPIKIKIDPILRLNAKQIISILNRMYDALPNNKNYIQIKDHIKKLKILIQYSDILREHNLYISSDDPSKKFVEIPSSLIEDNLF